MNKGEHTLMVEMFGCQAIQDLSRLRLHLCPACHGAGSRKCTDPNCGDNTYDHLYDEGEDCLRCDGTGLRKHPPVCESCNRRAVHAENFGARVRFWCADHTPWSGHYEFCGATCENLLREAIEKEAP